MDETSWLTLADEAVYRRTRGGQQELVFRSRLLTALQLRLLAVFTGHTPLRTIADLIGDDVHFGSAVEALLKDSLIEPVPQSELSSQRR